MTLLSSWAISSMVRSEVCGGMLGRLALSAITSGPCQTRGLQLSTTPTADYSCTRETAVSGATECYWPIIHSFSSGAFGDGEKIDGTVAVRSVFDNALP